MIEALIPYVIATIAIAVAFAVGRLTSNAGAAIDQAITKGTALGVLNSLDRVLRTTDDLEAVRVEISRLRAVARAIPGPQEGE
jgi:hypothetical protein